MPHKRGFTLIEILVVVSIVTIIAAILFPVFARARESAKRSSRLSNIKQIGLATMQYVHDNDAKFPRHVSGLGYGQVYDFANPAVYHASPNFLSAILPYIKTRQLLACPSPTPLTNAFGRPTAFSDTNYVSNAVIVARGLSETLISNPSEIIYFQEYQRRMGNATPYPFVNVQHYTTVTESTPYRNWHTPNTSGQPEIFSNLHFEGGNLLFCDGHAKWRKFHSIRSGEFGLTPDQLWSQTNAIDPDGPETEYLAAF